MHAVRVTLLFCTLVVFAANESCRSSGDCVRNKSWCDSGLVCYTGQCVRIPGVPCSHVESCDAEHQRCIPKRCRTSAECDNGLFCDGTERCLSGVCRPGEDTCAAGQCDEAKRKCDMDIGQLTHTQTKATQKVRPSVTATTTTHSRIHQPRKTNFKAESHGESDPVMANSTTIIIFFGTAILLSVLVLCICAVNAWRGREFTDDRPY